MISTSHVHSALAPRNVSTLKTLASLHMLHTGNDGRARALFQRALDIAPAAPDAADLREILDELRRRRPGADP